MNKRKWITYLAAAILLVATLTGLVIHTAAVSVTPEMTIAACNLSFRDTVCIKYAVASNVEDVKLLIWDEAQSEYTVGTETAQLSSVESATVNGTECLIFDYTALAAKQMTDVVYARAWVRLGGEDYYSAPNKYSILQYSYNKLGKTGTASSDEDLKEMLESMLTYGAGAQKYLDYKTDRLATLPFYQVMLNGGLLSDGFRHGLYLAGDRITMTAPMTNSEGATFSHWNNAAGTKVGTTASVTLTVGSANEVYTPVYVKYSSGLEFDSNGDGTCYVIGIGDCTDSEIVIPAVSPDGDTVIGIDNSAFAGEAITSVSFPSTLEEIGRRAFNGCNALTDVYYDGTEEEWNEKVNIAAGNTPIENATMHFVTPPAKTFTVKFVDFDGTELKTETVEEGKSATAPATPTRDGYTFTGWDKAFDNITADITVTAQYQKTEINYTEPTIVVESESAKAGDTVEVTVSLKNNPGLASLQFDVAYDSALELQSIAFNPAFGAYVTAPEPYANPQGITFISPLVSVDADGEFATLTFKVAEGVAEASDLGITLNLNQGNIYDENFNEVTFDVVNGSVTVTK